MLAVVFEKIMGCCCYPPLFVKYKRETEKNAVARNYTVISKVQVHYICPINTVSMYFCIEAGSLWFECFCFRFGLLIFINHPSDSQISTEGWHSWNDIKETIKPEQEPCNFQNTCTITLLKSFCFLCVFLRRQTKLLAWAWLKDYATYVYKSRGWMWGLLQRSVTVLGDAMKHCHCSLNPWLLEPPCISPGWLFPLESVSLSS